MFHTGRCGSTVLTDLVGQHPDVYWDGETYGRVIERIKTDGLERDQVDFDPVDYVIGRLSRSGRCWFGYDLKFSHITEFGVSVDDYVSRVSAAGITEIVTLRRRNYLRQVISARNAGRRGHFHLQQEQEREVLSRLELRPYDLDVDLYRGSLLDHFRRWDDLYETIDEITGPDALHLVYEDHIQRDPSVAYQMVAEFLALKRFAPEIRLRRSNPEPVRALLANGDEIADYLADSPYSWMVDD